MHSLFLSSTQIPLMYLNEGSNTLSAATPPSSTAVSSRSVVCAEEATVVVAGVGTTGGCGWDPLVLDVKVPSMHTKN